MPKKSPGRPAKYTNAKNLLDEAKAYFALCENNRQLPEKAGLCIALGITRETYNQYKQKPEFSDAIKGFELYIESNWVRRLGGNAPTGAIFYLKNAFSAQYRDKHDTDITSGGRPINFGWEK